MSASREDLVRHGARGDRPVRRGRRSRSRRRRSRRAGAGPTTTARYPGYCLNCHSGFAVSPPAISSGATPTHRDRGSNCAQCHTINTPPPPPPPARVPVTYMKGADRYLTAIDVSKKSFANGAPAVVLATGANFPDALCAAPLAKAYGGPILLVRPGTTLSADVAAEITRLHPVAGLHRRVRQRRVRGRRVRGQGDVLGADRDALRRRQPLRHLAPGRRGRQGEGRHGRQGRSSPTGATTPTPCRSLRSPRPRAGRSC